MILFIKHIDIEGPETIGTYFQQKGMSCKVLNLPEGDVFPEDLNGIDAVISLGGPMNVYEEDQFAFLKDEDVFIKKVLEKKVPFLGLCLGSQLLAKAANSKVVKSPTKEVGFSDVHLTPEGQADPLFQGIEDSLNVFQWHEDMSEVPADAKLLVTSSECPVQAFKVGPKAYGLQFHIEITDKSITEWSDRYITDEKILNEQKPKMLDDYQNKKVAFQKVAHRIYENLFQIIFSKDKVN